MDRELKITSVSFILGIVGLLTMLVGVLNIFCWWLKRKCGPKAFKVVENV